MATVEISSGNQTSRSANRNWETSSPPYGYGGRNADHTVLPVRIIMSPNSSSKCRVGMNARSVALRTMTVENPSSGWYGFVHTLRHAHGPRHGGNAASLRDRRPQAR